MIYGAFFVLFVPHELRQSAKSFGRIKAMQVWNNIWLKCRFLDELALIVMSSTSSGCKHSRCRCVTGHQTNLSRDDIWRTPWLRERQNKPLCSCLLNWERWEYSRTQQPWNKKQISMQSTQSFLLSDSLLSLSSSSLHIFLRPHSVKPRVSNGHDI